MDNLPEFSQDDISSNIQLFYLSKLIEKINILS